MNYYNEFDKKAAAWLRELIKHGHIPNGEVDERSITEVRPDDLSGFTQCHFFAGIGGWSLALRMAGWPEDRPVWTGSCPCQPFSIGGDSKGAADERHLWPVFFRLIKERKPHAIFGEQVARAIGFNWLDGISTDLEGEGYAVGTCVLGAHSAGAPHIRQRVYWVADSECEGLQGRGCSKRSDEWTRGQINSRGFYSQTSTIEGSGGKVRRIEPKLAPLAYGVPGRVGLLRGYGNAIVPQVGAEFISAFMHAQDNRSN